MRRFLLFSLFLIGLGVASVGYTKPDVTKKDQAQVESVTSNAFDSLTKSVADVFPVIPKDRSVGITVPAWIDNRFVKETCKGYARIDIKPPAYNLT